jgi:hypothetical protein
MANDDQYTPKALFDAMGVDFDLDVAAPKDGIPWIPTKAHYSIEDNALEKPWWGMVWMNPPYSKPSPWVDKFIAHGNGVALLPMSKSGWTSRLWDAADGIAYVGAMKFVQKDGKNSQIYMPVLLYAMGDVAVAAIKRAGHGKMR